MDVIERVKPVIIELERQRRSIVIVCHLAVLRYASQRSAEGCSDCVQTAFLSV
jgi:broad specificity phosphatase PhoE